MKRFLLIPWLLISCADSIPSETKAYIAKDIEYGRWRDPKNIPVCWERGDKAPQEKLDMIAEAVTKQYARVGIGFSFQGPCEKGSRGIHVVADTEGKDHSGIGPWLDGRTGGMHLNFHRRCAKEIKPDTCLINTALHEFGHALGLYHEMNRRDQTGCKKDQTEGLGDDDAIQLGPYDKNSIMNYCRNRNTEELSENDVAVMSDYYFAPIARIYGHVPASLKSPPSLYVSGPKIVAYRWLLTGNVEDCSRDEAYSAVQTKGDSIVPNLDTFAVGQRIHFCAIGQNEAGEWQKIRSYSSVTWTKKSPDSPF